MVGINASAEITLSVAEVTARLRLMSDVDKIRFIRASNYLSFGGARSPSDLRQEAVRRAIDGTRKCPSNISIVAFLKGAMRSIASADRKAIARGPKLAVVPSDGATAQGVLDGIDPRLSTEDRMIQQNRVDEIRGRILGLFEDDPVAQLVAEGMMDEMDGTELRELVELTETLPARRSRQVSGSKKHRTIFHRGSFSPSIERWSTTTGLSVEAFQKGHRLEASPASLT